MKKLLLIICFILISVNAFADATINSSGCSQEEIATALATASSSSGVVTVVIPAGECTHTAGTTVNMSSGFTNVTTLNIEGASQTGTQITGGSFIVTASATKYINIRRMTFIGKNYEPYVGSGAFIVISGTTAGFRIHNITWSGITGRAIYGKLGAYGVVDSNSGTTYTQFSTFEGGDTYGNTEWNTGAALGSVNSVYLENNSVEHLDGGEDIMMFADGSRGARIVVRYNTLINFYLGGHDASTNYRGILQYEAYNNHMTSTFSYDTPLVAHRGGTGAIYSNRFYHTHDSPFATSGASAIWFRNWRDAGGYSTTWTNNMNVCGASDYKAYLGTGATSWGICTSGATCLDIDGGTGTAYPCRDQIGTGDNLVPQSSKPFLLWDNQVQRASNDFIDCPVYEASGTIVKDRDYCEHATTMPATCNEVATTYTAYTCPHPLTGNAEGCTTDAYGTTGYNTGEDATAPTCTFSVDSTGLIATGTCSESVDAVTKTGLSFTGSVTGAITATYKDGMPGANPRFDLGSEVQQSDIVTADYTTPGTGIKDTAGNALANFSGASVFNGSTQNTPPTYAVTINKTGTGCTITSSPSGANCGETCSVTVDNGTMVTLGGYLENGWASITYGGDCAANGTVTVNADKTCTVTCTPIYLFN